MNAPRLTRFLLAALAMATLWAFSASGASAEFGFCPAGEGAGQCSDPQGLATDFETGRLFVADRGNHRVDVFEEDRTFLFAFGWGVDSGTAQFETCTTASGCQKGLTGEGAGQLTSPQWIAVDNDPGSPTRHHVYVSDANSRINHFEPDGSFVGAFGWGVETGANELESCTTASGCQIGIPGGGECQVGGAFRSVAAGPGGNVFVAISTGSEPNFTDKVEKFSPAGECLGETVLIEGDFRLTTLAVDSAEDAYVAVEGANRETRKYDLAVAETELCDVDDGIQTNELTLDAEGHLFAYQRELRAKGAGVFDVIAEYDPSCQRVRRFGYDKLADFVRGIATLHTPEGVVFASEDDTPIQYLASGGPGPISIGESLEVTFLGNTAATVYGEANPEGKATDARLDYVSDADFEKDIEEGGDGFEGPTVKSETKPLDIKAGKGFRATAVEFQLGCPVPSEEAIEEGECLIPASVYHWRVVATNEDNPSGTGEALASGPEFETKHPAEATLFVTGVDATTATLNALVNPLGTASSGFFEYVDQQSFEESEYTKASRFPAAGEIDLGAGNEAKKHSAALYPLKAGTTYRYRLGVFNPLLEEPVFFEETFRTFKVPVKEPCPQNEAFRTGASELLPDCRAYELVSPLDKENGDIVVLNDPPAVISQSALSGERLTYGSYRAFGDAVSAPYTSQYLAVRNPEEGWQSRGISPPQGHSIKGSVEVDFEFRAFSDDLCQGWIVPLAGPPLAEDANPDSRNLYRRDDRLCGEERYVNFSPVMPERLAQRFKLEPHGIAAEGEVAAFLANDTLQGSGAPAQPGACGEANVGACKLRLYVKGPEGPPRFACVLPGGGANGNASCSGGSFAPGSFFGPTRAATVEQPLSEDGSRLYWTAAEGEGKVYVRENPLGEGGECSGEGTPCTYPVSAEGEAEAGANNSFLAAAATDGSIAHYTTGSLAAGSAHLFEYDFEEKESTELAGAVFGVLGASEDGARVYFASGEVLDETENEHGAKAVAGKPNLYLHEAGEALTFIGTLSEDDVNPDLQTPAASSATAPSPAHHNSRISPSGLHIAFMSTVPLTGYDNLDAKSEVPDNEVYLYDAGMEELLCASCNPSGARPQGENLGTGGDPFWIAARLAGHQSSLYPGRNLSPAGTRLYFESLDPLVPRDTNRRLDVYQWEREGTSGCDEQTVTFTPSASGCIDLISSGQSIRNSVFLDASASGEDVFLATLSGLLPEDYGLVDAYDARVGGGFPSPPLPAIECEGETCQSPAPAPEFQTPSTSTYEGPENLAAPKAKKRRCAKAQRKRRARCLKNKGKGKAKRAASKRRAGR